MVFENLVPVRVMGESGRVFQAPRHGADVPFRGLLGWLSSRMVGGDVKSGSGELPRGSACGRPGRGPPTPPPVGRGRGRLGNRRHRRRGAAWAKRRGPWIPAQRPPPTPVQTALRLALPAAPNSRHLHEIHEVHGGSNPPGSMTRQLRRQSRWLARPRMTRGLVASGGRLRSGLDEAVSVRHGSESVSPATPRRGMSAVRSPVSGVVRVLRTGNSWPSRRAMTPRRIRVRAMSGSARPRPSGKACCERHPPFAWIPPTVSASIRPRRTCLVRPTGSGVGIGVPPRAIVASRSRDT